MTEFPNAGHDLSEAVLAAHGGREIAAGPELDSQIAEKVMGWGERYPKAREKERGRWWRDATGMARITAPSSIPGADFHPSTDWGAAGEVLERLAARGCTISIGIVENAAQVTVWDNEDDEIGYANESTTQGAICRAALAAVEATEREDSDD